MCSLWMAIEPSLSGTRVMMTAGGMGTVMRARFPQFPRQQDALKLFLRGVAGWYGRSFCAVVDADAEDVSRHPERWARYLGDLDDSQIRVEWRGYSESFRRDSLVGTVGDFRRARRLITYSATGQK